jgi:hypothetical protein
LYAAFAESLPAGNWEVFHHDEEVSEAVVLISWVMVIAILSRLRSLERLKERISFLS